MPTKKESVETVETHHEEFMTLKELAVFLIRHYRFHEGLFDLSVQFRIGTGAIGPDEDNLLPGAMIGLSGIGLKRVSKIGQNTLDAAEVNPARKTKRTTKPSAKSKN